MDIPESSEVGIGIYDVPGRLVKQIWAGRMAPGSGRHVRIEMSEVPSGLYVYHVTAVGTSKQVWRAQGKMLLVK